MERDPQVGRLFAATPQATLAHLARHSRPIDAQKAEISHQHLAECFPDFPKVLDDLSEQRIVLGQRIGNAELNNDHVVLGFALLLLQLAEANLGVPEASLRDRFATALEPNREDDTRTEALYVALLLTLLRDPPDGQNWDNTRRALLILWCGGHNARRTPTRMSFWARTDLGAYRRVVESLFTRYLSGDQDTELVTPIALRWREVGMGDSAVVQLLSDWLTLVFPGVDPNDLPEQARDRARFPHAESHQQLRLAFAALSIISLRPEDGMLPALVRSAHSCQLCQVKEENNGRVHDVRLKTPYENFGILLRWNYTEAVVPKLVSLANATKDEPAAQHGLWVLSECLHLVELPKALQRPEPYRPREPRDDSPPTVVKEFRKWIHDMPSAQIHWPSVWRLELIVEDPAATLDARDIDRLRADIARTLIETSGSQPGRDAVAELFPSLFPWLARFAPSVAQEMSSLYWSYAIRSANPAGAAMVAPVIPLPAVVLARLVEETRGAIERIRSDSNLGAFLTRLTKVFLVSGDEDVIINWFEVMLALPRSHFGEEWRILPVPYMLERIATPTLSAASWERFEQATGGNRGAQPTRAVSYWLNLYASLVRGSSEAGRKALALATSLPVDHAWAAPLLEIVAASRDAAVVDEALRNPEFRKHFQNPNVTHSFAWFLKLPPASPLSAETRKLLPVLPPTVGAELLRWTNSANEHLSFAHLLAESALRRAAGGSCVAEAGFELSWDRSHDDHRAWWHIDEIESESATNHSDLSAVWGVNRGRMTDQGAAFSDDSDVTLKERNSKINAAIQRCREKLKGAVDQYLVRFHGRLTLEQWGQFNPNEFRGFAQKFFATLGRNQTAYFELSLFCDDVLSALTTIDVSAAALLNKEFFGDGRGAVLVDGIIPSFVYRVMDSDLDGQAPEITALRIVLLEQSRNDRDYLATVMAAIQGKTLDWLRRHAYDNFSKSPLAKDRTKAVSLLAFAGVAEDRGWLKTLVCSDPSEWVREHAEWAINVHDQSATAHTLWDETLVEIMRPSSDLLLISTRLARLQALLPPTAVLWERPAGPTPAANALVIAFWYSWQNGGGAKAEREICGRKLQEYYRGERLADVTKRMAPWWVPE